MVAIEKGLLSSWFHPELILKENKNISKVSQAMVKPTVSKNKRDFVKSHVDPHDALLIKPQDAQVLDTNLCIRS